MRRSVTGLAAALILAPAAVQAAPAQAAPTGASPPPSAVPAVQGGPQLDGPGVIVNYPAHGAMPLPSVPASAYVIADTGTGQVLAAKDPHGWFHPASTLKVLTAEALMPLLNPDATVTASQQAAAVTPTKVGLVQGDQYPVSSLFQALLLISANDAAIALAQATGSYDEGMALINAEAHRLQAYDTVAGTPNGLDAPGQHVSAYDEALFARQALSMPALMRIEAMRTAQFPLTAKHLVTLWNQNTMLTSYPGDLGGKIGWTSAAGAAYIGWAERGGRTLIVTILHCHPLMEMTAAAALLNWGFAMDGRVTPVGVLVRPLAGPGPAQRPGQHGTSRTAPRGITQRLARPARLSAVPSFPLAAAAGALLLAGLTAAVMIVGVSRRRRGGGRSGP